MAKSERHPWPPYGPHWNYYPTPVLNFPNLPIHSGQMPSGHTNENYLPIRCPEPRRPYQLPFSPAFANYCHQEPHGASSFVQPPPIYQHHKQYLHKPIPHDNYTNPYRFNENDQSYPACSNNFQVTKDLNNYYQNAWNTTSQFQRKPPEQDVRHFLATWQEKDDDGIEVPSESEERRIDCQVYDSVPLDCSKRNNSDKNVKSQYEQYSTGQSSNTTGCVVQPYYIKDNTSLGGTTSNEEMNNNIPQRNNLNYGHVESHDYFNKKLPSHPEYWKFPNDKLLHNENNTYSQPLNHCDSNNFKSHSNFKRQKNNLLETSERSHYNLSSSLESGDLFCDINSRSDDHHKPPPIAHPIFNDHTHRETNCHEPTYFENNNFPENLVYTDLNSMKDSWELFPSSTKCSNAVTNQKQNLSSAKLHTHTTYEQAVTISKNDGPIIYEGAFNILPNLNDSHLSIPNSVQYTDSNSHSVVANDPSKLSFSTQSLISSKGTSSNVPKCNQGNSKVRPYQFNDEISSDDIDISIASSGDLIIDEDQSSSGSISAINFSKHKKEKKCNLLIKSDKGHYDHSAEYLKPLFPNHDLVKSPITAKNADLSENTLVDSVLNVAENTDNDPSSYKNVLSPKHCFVDKDEPLKSSVMDLTVLKPHNSEVDECQKQEIDYLDLSNNYFGNSNFSKNTEAEFQHDIDNRHDTPQKNSCEYSTAPEDSCTNSQNTASSQEAISLDGGAYCGSSSNDNLLLLAHCSQEYGSQIAKCDEPPKSPVENNIPNLEEELKEPQEELMTKHEEPINIQNSEKFFLDYGYKFYGDSEIHQTTYQEDFNQELKNVESPQKSLQEINHNSKKLPEEDTDDQLKKVQETLPNSSKNCHQTTKHLKQPKKCSQEHGCQIAKKLEKSQKREREKSHKKGENAVKPIRDSVIKCSLRWDKIFNVSPNDNSPQPDMSIDLGPAKVELRIPPENNSSTGLWKVVEAEKTQTSSIVQVRRLILKRKSEERLPKIVIKKTGGEKYKSFYKKEPSETVLNCGKYKLFCDISPKSKLKKHSKKEEYEN